ncbi:MAG: 50S ribosomal protein L15 [Candidatus Heimdallarchaeota archaeon]|nr:50S ribosomal protein L15 [Candidatus Heimdallarchaeota archaeon]
MTVRTRKRVRRERGYRTHGWGIVRTHRKSGMRGGVGNAGPKSHHKLLVIKGIRPPLGKRGFAVPPSVVEDIPAINISHLEAMLPTLLKEGKITKKGEVFEINLIELGYKKVLAQGKITVAMNITTKYASERAVSKVKAAGGKVKLLE